MNCGSCKWLDVPPADLKRDGTVRKRLSYMMFQCKVPFETPAFPSCFSVSIQDNRYTCPAYGTECEFHEIRYATDRNVSKQ